jgi:hypothetical protein
LAPRILSFSVTLGFRTLRDRHFPIKEERKAALMPSLSTSVPVHLEMNLSDVWIEWVAPINQKIMARSDKESFAVRSGNLREVGGL